MLTKICIYFIKNTANQYVTYCKKLQSYILNCDDKVVLLYISVETEYFSLINRKFKNSIHLKKLI